jgi:hypothetical protein
MPSNNEMDKEMKKQMTAELAKEKLQKYKLSCTRLEAKKGLEPLTTRDGHPVQNAMAFNQWEKQLVNWMKTVNVYWAIDPSTSMEKKGKHAKQYTKALETLYICLESAVLDPVAKAEVQDEANGCDGARALARLQTYFRKEKDEINLEAIEDDFRACKPAPGETIEAWLLRIRQFEVLLSNTERKKTDSEVLTIIKRNLPKEFGEFKLKYAMKEGVQRDSYVRALKKWAQYLQYPAKAQSADLEGQALVVSAKPQDQACAATMPVQGPVICPVCNKRGHHADQCWKSNPSLKPEWVKRKEERRKSAKSSAVNDAGGAQCPSCQHCRPGVQHANVTSEVTTATTQPGKWNISLCTGGPSADQGSASFDVSWWIIDSGSSRHITPDKSNFVAYVSLKEPITINGVSGDAVKAIGIGKVALDFVDATGDSGTVTLSNVLHIPGSKFRLVSVSQVMDKGAHVTFGDEAAIQLPGGPNVKLVKNGNLFLFPHDPKVVPSSDNSSALVTQGVGLSKWHARMGHRSKESIHAMVKGGMVKGIVLGTDPAGTASKPCDTCKQANMKKVGVPKVTNKRSQAPNMRVFTDTTGIIKGADGKALRMFGGTTVFQIFVDDATRRVKMYPMAGKTEDDYLLALKKYIPDVGQPMAILRSDGASEFQSQQCQQFYAEHRIKREITPADTPQYNGVAERAIQSVFQMARALRLQADVPLHLAPFAVMYAVHIYNSVSHKALKGHTPHEAWTGEVPDASQFRVFGCKVWVMSTQKHLPKFSSRSRCGVFLGFPCNAKGYLCYFPDTKRVVVTHQPVFDEESFPFADANMKDHFSTAMDNIEVVDDSVGCTEAPQMHDFDLEMLDQIRRAANGPSELLHPLHGPDTIWNDDRPEAGDDLAPEDFQNGDTDRPPSQVYPRRVRNPPGEYWMASNAATAISLSAVESVVKAGNVFEPSTYKEAMSSSDKTEWQESITKEVDTLLANDTFEVIDKSQVPKGRRIIKSKWVFKVKRDSQGNFLSRKTRLVAKGFTQLPGVDYFEIFHPVGKGTTMRLLSAKAACRGMKLYHVDVKGAFLHAPLEEEIYMELPGGSGFEVDGQPCIVRLKKTLYGLKQAGHEWFVLHVGVLLSMGFKASKVDACLYTHAERGIWVLVYVDDDLVAVHQSSDFEWFVTELSKHFTVGSAALADNYLGIRIQQQDGVVKMDQQAQVEELLRKYGMEGAKPTATPATPGQRLNKLSSEEELTQEPYRSLVGSLLYLSMHTRPDITYAVSELSKHCASPGAQHWVAAKRVLRYLCGTRTLGLEFRKEAGMELTAAADSDWAGGWNDQTSEARSTSGYVITIAGSVISARSKRQNCVALSSCEAEYISLALAAQEIVHCRQLLIDLGEPQNSTVLKCDNMAAGELTKNETHQQRSKHIAIRYHFIRECVKRGEIKVEWCSGQNNMADMFTKPLGRILFEKYVRTLLAYV